LARNIAFAKKKALQVINIKGFTKFTSDPGGIIKLVNHMLKID
jgi:hypothetical protein